MTEHLDLIEVQLQFLAPLETATGAYSDRRSILVGSTVDGVTGWGEAPSFPSGRFGSTEAAWEALTERLTDPGAVPIANAALQAARLDRAAREAGVTLHEWLGAEPRPMKARHPVGLIDRDRLHQVIDHIDRHGIVAVKVKIAPERVSVIRELRAALPDLDIGVDANGTFADPDDKAFADLAQCGVSFVEQPFVANDLDANVALVRRKLVPVCLDEAVESADALRRITEVGAADQVSIKLNRHGWERFQQMRSIAFDAGIAVRVGGTFDTSIGRRHLLAAAMLEGVVDAELGPPSGYLAADVADYPPLVDGAVTPSAGPGIDTTPHRDDIDHLIARRTRIAG